MKRRIIGVFICLVFIVILTRVSVAAFNPFLKLRIENIDTTNYIVDLLIDNSKNEYKKASDEDIREENDIFQNIQKEYDGWNLANYYGNYVNDYTDEEDSFYNTNPKKIFKGVYFGQYVGNNNFYHEFYANDDGVGPLETSTYKIILINKDTGEIKISNEVKNNKNQNLTIDAKTMKIYSNEHSKYVVKIVIGILAIILLLIVIIYKKLIIFINGFFIEGKFEICNIGVL